MGDRRPGIKAPPNRVKRFNCGGIDQSGYPSSIVACFHVKRLDHTGYLVTDARPRKSDRDQGISVGGRTSDENWVGPTVDDGLLISVRK